MMEWDRARKFLLPAIEKYSDFIGEEDVLRMIREGRAQLWAFERSAVVTEIITFPRAKVLSWWLCGGDLEELRENVQGIVWWARSEGCTFGRFVGRRAWLRILGYEPKFAVAWEKLDGEE